LEGHPADVRIRAAAPVEQPDLELVVNVVDAVDGTGVIVGGSPLAEAADRAAQDRGAVDRGNRDLGRVGNPRIADERVADRVLEVGVD